MSKPIPTTQKALQFVGVDQAIVNPNKEVYEVGPRQILVEVEACGICFSDIKLIKAFDAHPRRAEIVAGLSPEELAEIPSYKPGSVPIVPGHEPVGRIVKVGDQVTDYQVGDRFLIQTDYRHLPTEMSNAAFGYNFEGALQEYTLMDERVITDPDTGESFLIPVTEAPAASAVALIEPWATVEAAYQWTERQTLKEGGDLLIVVDEGRGVEGVGELVAQAAPGSITIVGGTYEGAAEKSFDEAAEQTFDDIIYFGSSADTIEKLEGMLGNQAILDVVLGGETVDRKALLDAGRVHYDLIRFVGTRGTSAADGYARIPATPALRPADKMAIIGAAGPMGLMHTVLSIVSGTPDISIDATDMDDARLARLEEVAGPKAAEYEVPLHVINSSKQDLTGPYGYVTVMVPVPALVSQAVDLAGPNSIVNAFAGIPSGKPVAMDIDKIVGDGVYLAGTSGSRIADMVAIKNKLEAGIIDTNVSLWAVSGLAGVPEALQMIENRTSGGKIIVYPELADLGVVKLSEMREKFPVVFAEMADGMWTRAAEKVLLAEASK